MSSIQNKKTPTCEGCRQQVCLKAGKPCERIERWLRINRIKSRDWIRPQVSKNQWEKDEKGRWREVPFSALSRMAQDKNPYFRT